MKWRDLIIASHHGLNHLNNERNGDKIVTHIYFIRHAEPDFTNHDDETRPLTPRGEESAKELIENFKEITVDVFISSPFKRAIDTIKPLAVSRNSKIEIISEFQERKISDGWIDDFSDFSKKQWQDFDYKLPHGESLNEVQERNIKRLMEILNQHTEKTIVIGTHGTALSMIINHFDRSFNHQDFDMVKNKMPWIVKMTFEGMALLGMERD